MIQSEEDLAELKKPMAFAVFGRGRVLPGLIGAGINADVIEKTCRVLLAACSCDLKELHPGFELPLAADWLGPTPPAPPGRASSSPSRPGP